MRAQLQRLLSHQLFTASKRYPTLLAYIVEQTLQGNASEIKERTIGVGAFGRAPDYDANADPVVRIAAAEVRKRLVQYYYDPAHAGELVIELLPGSYVPAFRDPGVQVLEPLKAVQLTVPDEDLPVVSLQARRVGPAWLSRPWVRYTLVAVAACIVGLAIGRYGSMLVRSDFDRFWEPFVTSSNPVTYCVGEPGRLRAPQTPTYQDLPVRVVGRLDVADVVTLARTIVPLVPRRGAFRVLLASETGFAQLREGPNVLIGAFDNFWTLRLTEKLRFGFEWENGISRLVDRKGGKRTIWEVKPGQSYRDLGTDYAIVARIADKLTGQPVIIVGGILDKGTEAASEVLYNPTYLDAVLAKAPSDWAHLNLEAIIKTQLIEGHPGPPTVVAVETWPR